MPDHKITIIAATLMSFSVGVRSSSAQSTESLSIITKFADENCVGIKQDGNFSSESYKSNVKAEISGVIKKIIGAEGSAGGTLEFDRGKYEGVVQDELSAALKDVRTCRQNVIKLLLPIAGNFTKDNIRIMKALSPGSSPTPTNRCTNLADPESLTVLLGSNAFVSNRFPHVVIRAAGRNILEILKHSDGSLGINMDVIGPDGRFLAKVRDNVFDINDDNLLSYESPSSDKLTIKSRDQKTYVSAEFINPQTLRISGHLQYKGNVIDMGPSAISVGALSLSSNCFVNTRTDISIE